MDLIEMKKEVSRLTELAKPLSAKRKTVMKELNAVTRELSNILIKKEELERQIVKTQLIPTGRSGKQKEVRPKDIDINSLSDEVAQELLQALIARVS